MEIAQLIGFEYYYFFDKTRFAQSRYEGKSTGVWSVRVT